MPSICFVTSQSIAKHAAMKRTCGMSRPLADAGWDVHVVAQDDAANVEAVPSHPRIRLHLFPEMSLAAERQWKRKFLARNSWDYIYYNSLSFRNVVFAPRSCGARLVEVSEIDSAIVARSYAYRAAAYFLAWYQLVRTDVQVCASRFLERWVQTRCRATRIVRPTLYSPYAVDDQFARQQLERPDFLVAGRPTILHFGSVAASYGANFLFDALRQLRSADQSWIAYFVGGGEDYRRMKRAAEAAGADSYIRYVGYVDESTARGAVQHADVYLSHINATAQDRARCPSKIYYYMVGGQPIVTTPIGETREALGGEGFYYNPDDLEGAVDQMRKALTAPRRLREYPDQSFLWSTRTQDFLRDLERLRRGRR